MKRTLLLACPQCGTDVEFAPTNVRIKVGHTVYEQSWRPPVIYSLDAEADLTAFHTCPAYDGTVSPPATSNPQQPPNGESQ